MGPDFTASPIIDFAATFVTGAQKASPFPKHRPVKPDLLSFSTKKPKYDKFCDPKRRTTRGFDKGAMPEDSHPCKHTYEHKVTEQRFWGCSDRDIARDYVEGLGDYQQQELEAKVSRTQDVAEIAGMSVELAASVLMAL